MQLALTTYATCLMQPLLINKHADLILCAEMNDDDSRRDIDE